MATDPTGLFQGLPAVPSLPNFGLPAGSPLLGPIDPTAPGVPPPSVPGTTPVPSSTAGPATGGGFFDGLFPPSVTAGAASGATAGAASGAAAGAGAGASGAGGLIDSIWEYIERGGLLLFGIILVTIGLLALLWQSKTVQVSSQAIARTIP